MRNIPLFCSLVVCMVAFFVSSSFVVAQNTEKSTLPKASVNKELYIMLSQDAPEDTKIFEADITNLNLTTLEDANRFFSFFNDASVEFVTDIVAQKVKITLMPNTEKENWKLREWGTYFKRKISTQRKQFGTYMDFTKK